MRLKRTLLLIGMVIGTIGGTTGTLSHAAEQLPTQQPTQLPTQLPAPNPSTAYRIDRATVENIDLNPAPQTSGMGVAPLEQMHHNIVHDNLGYSAPAQANPELNALAAATPDLDGHEQLNNLVTRPIVVCDHPNQLSHVLLNRRYFNSLPEQYLLEAESDLNRLTQHYPDFKERLQEQGSVNKQRLKRHEFEAMLLQDYAQRRKQDTTNTQLYDFYADELRHSLHFESLMPQTQNKLKHESKLNQLTQAHGAEITQKTAAAIEQIEATINSPLKLKLQQSIAENTCSSPGMAAPKVVAESLELFRRVAAQADPEAYITAQGVRNMVCSQGCTHNNPMHSEATPYFTFVTGCCWSATVPPSSSIDEFYVLFSNDCLNTQVEINILPHSQYTLPFLAQHVFTTLKEGEQNHTYSNVQLTVHQDGYLITYDVLGVANAHFFTTSGTEIASIVVTGDLIAGVEYINTFKRTSAVLPQLAIPEINRPQQTAVYTELHDLPFAQHTPHLPVQLQEQ